MSADTGPVQEVVAEEAVEQPVFQEEQQQADVPVQEQIREENVPLAALQKERRKRQEVEQELRWHKDQMMAKNPEPNHESYESLLEAATKEDLVKVKQQVIRDVQESSWIKANPEKVADINDKLSEFLKQRPNLASAIEAASNRYEEAWELMDKLSPKQKIALKAAPLKKDSPGNPASVPKAAAINQVLDFSSMSDSEFNAWRKSKQKLR